jgi:hypothetical protein
MADGGTYDQRYCAFIDILGFSALIGDIARHKTTFERVWELLQIVHEPTKLPIPGEAPLDIWTTSISDAIALSASFSAPGLAGLVDLIRRLGGGRIPVAESAGPLTARDACGAKLHFNAMHP